jgi:hypothetical protein
MTKSLTQSRDSKKSSYIVKNRFSIDIKQLVVIHLTFMVAYWASFVFGIVILHLFHILGWMGAYSFEFDLFSLFLSFSPLLLVVSVNVNQMSKLFRVARIHKTSLFDACILTLVSILLLIPITWFMRNVTVSVLVIPWIVFLVAWLTPIIYVVTAVAVVSSSPTQLVKRIVQQLQFWFFAGLTSLFIIIALIPLVVGLLGSEAWQYYSFIELLIRRLPVFVILTWPASILLPGLPLTVMYYEADREIAFLWKQLNY